MSFAVFDYGEFPKVIETLDFHMECVLLGDVQNGFYVVELLRRYC